MSQEKERVRQMSGEPRGCFGKPKQDADRRAEGTEGHLLPQSRVAAAVCGRGPETAPFTNCYSKTRKTKDSGTKSALTVVSPLTQAQFTPKSDVPRGFQIARARQIRSRSYLVLFACKDSSVITLLAAAGAKPPKKGNRKRIYRCFLKMFSSSTEIVKKNWQAQPGLPASTSEVRQIQHQLQPGNSNVFT